MDRGTIIYDIERCTCHVPDACKDCSHYTGTVGYECMEGLMRDALDLLKEQETANVYKCQNCGTWVSAENVVRCKDCKFGEACKNGAGEHGVMCYNSQSASHSWVHEQDWFCADGERAVKWE